jgi:hypothetical protein
MDVTQAYDGWLVRQFKTAKKQAHTSADAGTIIDQSTIDSGRAEGRSCHPHRF